MTGSNDTAIEYLRRCLAAADPATGQPLTAYERRLAEAELADRERHLERPAVPGCGCQGCREVRRSETARWAAATMAARWVSAVDADGDE